jgi:hypothetical protein
MPLYEFRTSVDPEDSGGDRHSALLVGAVAGALVGAVVVAVAWLGVTALGSGGSRPDRDAGGSRVLSSPWPPVTEEPAKEGETSIDLARCQEVFKAQNAPLLAAAASLDQWEVHIGAMNKLVTGAITLKQATQFWNQTRVGAATKLKSFAAAREEFRHRSARCPAPRSSEAGVVPERRACYRAVAARHQTLRLATVSLATWQLHVHHMEMLRRGEMSAQEATRLWLQNWHDGNDELRAYRAAARAAQGRTC